MFRILGLFFIAVMLGLVVSAQSFDFNPNSNSSNGTCAGGACSIDAVKNNTILQHDSNQFGQSSGLSPQTTGATESKGGIGGGTPFTYDFNCQFGNCIGGPTGSYKP